MEAVDRWENFKGTRSLWTFLNPGIYLISILPALALVDPGQAQSFLRLAWATLSLVLLQHGVNLLNDLEDDRRGADQNKWDSWIHYFQSAERLRRHGVAYFLVGALLGSACLIEAQAWGVILYSIPFVYAAYAYNRSTRPIAYSRYSEWVTAFCYGPGVVGALSVLAETPIQKAAGVALAFAAISAAVLLSHQIPQIADDRRVQKLSYAVRHGVAKTLLTTQILWSAGLMLILLSSASSWTISVLMLILGAILAKFFIFRMTEIRPKNILIGALSVVCLARLAELILPLGKG